MEQNDCSVSCPLLPVWRGGILFPGREIKVEVSAPNLQLAISRVLSTALRQIIFIVSPSLPGAAAVKKQFSETVIVSPIHWPWRCPGAAGGAGAPREHPLGSPGSAAAWNRVFPAKSIPQVREEAQGLRSPGSGRGSIPGSACGHSAAGPRGGLRAEPPQASSSTGTGC